MKGQHLYLTCELNKDREVTWKRNGKPFTSVPGKIQVATIGLQRAVTIQNAGDEEVGVYTCECENVKTESNVKVIGKSF